MIREILLLVGSILRLPRKTIAFQNSDSNTVEDFRVVYSSFTKRHRSIVFRNKSVGAALLCLNDFENYDEYVKSINGKNSAAYYARKAKKRNYTFSEIDRNKYTDAMFAINVSKPSRQGKAMPESYLTKNEYYVNKPHYRYFGVFDENNTLVSYCDIGLFGEFSLVSELLGHNDHLNDGVMYFMLVEVIRIMFDEYKTNGYSYVMYDMFLGSSIGLKKFKTKLGFKPYRVRWVWK